MTIAPPIYPPPRAVRHAFTLIELLVSMTVLTLLILMVSQMVSGATSITTSNRQHLDADSQARLVFDRMAFDFSRMLKRQDVDYIFKDPDKSPTGVPQDNATSTSTPPDGNDRFFFYAEAPAFFYAASSNLIPPAAQSSLSLIGYRVNRGSQKFPYQLSRLGKGLNWDEGNFSAQNATEPVSIAFLTPASTPSASATPTPDPATTLAGRWPKTLGLVPDYSSDDTDPGAAASYHVIADQVCRMEVCYLLKPRPAMGAAAAQPARYSVDPYYKVDGSGKPDPAHSAINGFQDVRAIVVALAVLDRASRQLTPNLSSMSTALRDITTNDLTPQPSAPATLMGKIWQDEIDSGKLATDANIPRAAAAQVRVYQRHFYLDTH